MTASRPRGTIRRVATLAATVVVLVLGVTIAQGASSSTPGGGLSVVPALLEHVAVPSSAGTIVLANTTKSPLNITVTPRPWVQSSSGAVTPNRHLRLTQLVSVDPFKFVLPAGASKSVTFTILQTPPGNSLYGNIEVIGIPVGADKHKGVSVGYRLISNLRLDAPTTLRKFAVSVSAPRVEGGNVVLAVRNTGNTIQPITGTVKITGSLGSRTATIASKTIVPGATVHMPLTALKGLARGRYTATYTLSQGGHVVSKATAKKFTISR